MSPCPPVPPPPPPPRLTPMRLTSSQGFLPALCEKSSGFIYVCSILLYTGWPRENATTLIVNFMNIVDETDCFLFYLVEHSFSNKMTP